MRRLSGRRFRRLRSEGNSLTQAAQRIADYTIVAKLGKGGMGWVFKGIHIETGKEAAIKILPPEMAKDEKFVTRFLREAQAATVLRHKNIVRVYEAGQYQSIYYIALELIDGETVAHAMEREKTIPLRQALDVVYQVAQGLAYAHQRGIVHRDIKPANIMITKDGVAKIMDMGLAKWTRSERFHDPTRPGFTVGSPAYMSPEQVLEPESLDGRTDIYSLGATLFHMLTGRPPHLGRDAHEVMVKIVKSEVNYPEEMPDMVVRLLKKMLAKKRSERFRNAGALIKALVGVMRHFGIDVSPTEKQRRRPTSSTIQKSLLPRPARTERGKKTPLPLILVGAAVLLLIVLVAVSSLSQSPPPQKLRTGTSHTSHNKPPKRPQVEPPVAPPPPKPHDEPEETKEKKAQKALAEALKWCREHPDELVEAYRRLEKVRVEYGTIVGAEITDHIEKLAAKMKDKIDKVIEEARKIAAEGDKPLAKKKLQVIVDKYRPASEISVEVANSLARAIEMIRRLEQ